jgi:hypothetical protein
MKVMKVLPRGMTAPSSVERKIIELAQSQLGNHILRISWAAESQPFPNTSVKMALS